MKSSKLALMVALSVLMCVINLVQPSKLLKSNDARIPPDQQLSYGPVPFEAIAGRLQLSDVVNQLTLMGLTLNLPTYLPNSISLTAVYAKTLDGNVSFPIELVYSNTGDVSIESAELIIEVMPMPEIPFSVTNSSIERFTTIGDRSAFVCEKAPVGWNDYFKKYGTENSILLDVKINSLNYLFRFSPIFTIEDAIHVAASL